MKQLLTTYTYDPATYTLSFTGQSIPAERILLITSGGTILYSLADGVGYASYNQATNSTLVLQPPTITLNNNSKFTIYYDDGVSYQNPLSSVGVSGTVTANAGTNLNTSSLALESGGNLASLNTKTPSLGQATMASSSPVVIASNQSSIPVSGTFWQTTQGVSGTVTANAGTNLNTSSLALESGGNLASLNTKLPSLGQATMASSTPVVIASNQSSIPVSGTFYQATQPISGTVTANAGTNLNTSSLALESGGNLASLNTKLPSLGQATMASSTPVVIASNQSSIPVSGTFYQATQPVSGTLNPDTSFTGAISSNGGTVEINTTSMNSVSFQAVLTQGTAPTFTIIPEVSVDGSTWVQTTYISVTSGGIGSSASAVPIYGQSNCTGFAKFRLRATSWTGGTGTPTITVTINASRGVSNVMLDNAVPAGSNTIGSVQIIDSSTSNKAVVKGGNSAAVAGDPAVVVSVSPNTPVKLDAGSNVIGTVIIGNDANSVNLSTINTSLTNVKNAINNLIDLSTTIWVDNSTTTPRYYIRREQANQGSITVSWENVDGTAASPTIANLVSIAAVQGIVVENTQYIATATSGSAYTTGDILIHTYGIDTASSPVSISFNIWFNASTAVILSAAPTAGNYATSATTQVSGSVSVSSGTVTANAGTNLNTSSLALESGGNLASLNTKTPALGQATMTNSRPVVIASNQSSIPVSGTFYQATQPVSGSVSVSSGTVTANAGTNLNTSSLALESGGNLAGINSKLPALGAAVKTSSIPVNIASDQTVPVSGSISVLGGNANAVKVDGSSVTQPISGTVTANAGTNLNTSSLALESGGNLAGINGKLPNLGIAAKAYSVPVNIASDQTVPVSGSIGISSLPAIPAGTNAIGSITNTSFVVSQTTAGNLNATVVQGSASNLNATVVQGTASNLKATALVSDGTNTAAVKAASTAALAADPALVVSVSPNTPIKLDAGTNAIGSITNSAFTANQSTAASLKATALVSDGTNTAAVKAASTAAVATDPALVVAVSPNNTVSVSGSTVAITEYITALAAGTASTLFSSNTNRKYLAVQNTSQYPMYLRIGNSAAIGTGFYLAPYGGSYIADGFSVPNGSVSLICASVGTYYAIQG